MNFSKERSNTTPREARSDLEVGFKGFLAQYGISFDNVLAKGHSPQATLIFNDASRDQIPSVVNTLVVNEYSGRNVGIQKIEVIYYPPTLGSWNPKVLSRIDIVCALTEGASTFETVSGSPNEDYAIIVDAANAELIRIGRIMLNPNTPMQYTTTEYKLADYLRGNWSQAIDTEKDLDPKVVSEIGLILPAPVKSLPLDPLVYSRHLPISIRNFLYKTNLHFLQPRDQILDMDRSIKQPTRRLSII